MELGIPNKIGESVRRLTSNTPCLPRRRRGALRSGFLRRGGGGGAAAPNRPRSSATWIMYFASSRVISCVIPIAVRFSLPLKYLHVTRSGGVAKAVPINDTGPSGYAVPLHI